jgi:hypothetical protein
MSFPLAIDSPQLSTVSAAAIQVGPNQVSLERVNKKSIQFATNVKISGMCFDAKSNKLGLFFSFIYLFIYFNIYFNISGVEWNCGGGVGDTRGRLRRGRGG